MSDSSSTTIVVVIGGGPVVVPPRLRGVEPFAVIAADGGFDAAIEAGLDPSHLVGDLDSITPTGLALAESRRLPVRRHPVDKDATDAELAVSLALELGDAPGAIDLVVLGPDHSDRLDHLLGAITALGHPTLATCASVRAFLGAAEVIVVHPDHRVTVRLPAGHVVSLLALHGPCAGVDVSGARWPLHDATLPAASSLGVSNESLGTPIDIATASGVLTVIIPHHEPEATS